MKKKTILACGFESSWSDIHGMWRGDYLSLPYCRLAERLRSNGIDVALADGDNLTSASGFVFKDMPVKKDKYLSYAKKMGLPCFLLIWENKFLQLRNADYDRYREFDVVFTYEDDAVRRYGCKKANYTFDFSLSRDSTIRFSDRRFAVMIATRFSTLHPHQLSYLRLKTLKYYEKVHPDKMDLYGRKWDKGIYAYMDSPNIYRYTHTLGIDRLLPRQRFVKIWRGPCERKYDVLGNYKFCYCYENTDEIPGYVTEKIFDAMMNGVVPVYLNHPSVKDTIPADCFVDRAAFRDDVELYSYLSSMSEQKWQGYLDAARRFLNSPAAKAFSIERFVEDVSREILVKI